jgi:hypothetical protein
MELVEASKRALDDGRTEYCVAARFTEEEASRIMAKKDLFAGEGIPLDPSIKVDDVNVFIDTPLQIAGLMIADVDTTARFTCVADRYTQVVRELDRYLRGRLASIWT